MSRSVLVTGAGGFIGRAALEAFRGRGWEVHAADVRTPPDLPADVWHAVNLLDQAEGVRLMKSVAPEAWLHLAWDATPGVYWTSAANVDHAAAALGLLRAFAEAGGRRVVMAGTCAEYDWSQGVLDEDTAALAPATLYGRCKNALRDITGAFCEQEGLSWAWGRVFFLYGPYEHPSRLVASVCRALVKGEKAATGSGVQVRDFLHVADVGGAFASLLSSEVQGAVNIASGEAVAIREAVSLLGELAGRPELIHLGALPDRQGDPARLVTAARRLREEAGFRPVFTLREGLAQTLQWWKVREAANGP